jgi:hypothetical protein
VSAVGHETLPDSDVGCKFEGLWHRTATGEILLTTGEVHLSLATTVIVLDGLRITSTVLDDEDETDFFFAAKVLLMSELIPSQTSNDTTPLNDFKAITASV